MHQTITQIKKRAIDGSGDARAASTMHIVLRLTTVKESLFSRQLLKVDLYFGFVLIII